MCHVSTLIKFESTLTPLRRSKNVIFDTEFFIILLEQSINNC